MADGDGDTGFGPGSDAPGTGSDDGGPIIDWSSLAPSWLKGDTANVLKDFAEAPLGFTAGIVLNVLVGGLENIAEAFIRAFYVIYEGDTVGSTQGSLGLADIPRVAANQLGQAGRVGGSALLDALAGFFSTVESGAAAAGPAAPILAAIAVAVVILAGAYLLRLVATLIVDSLNPL